MKSKITLRSFLILLISVLLGLPSMGYAQPKGGKMSASTRLVLADREGKISLDNARKQLRAMKAEKRQKAGTATPHAEEREDNESELPIAAPFMRNGEKYVQSWIRLEDNNTSNLEAQGVKITARFDKLVIADIPVNVLEQVAAVSNVRKVEMARMLSKKTYVSRQMTNVDDVLNLTSDATSAGLSQAYDGTGVVLGVIDTGIDFGHTMLSGSRLKKKYVYNETDEAMQEYTGTTYYTSDETHGTHTSTIAGGSDYTATAYVYTTSTSYTTISNAKFGGMAPGTDLVLCDLGDYLSDANIAWSMQKIAEYAESVGKPYVISLSLGSHYGPHDGTGDMAEVTAQLTGPGKIVVYASGNEGEDGIYLGKNASASNPSQTVLTSETRSSYSVDYGMMISYARTPNTELAVRYHVVNTSTNAVLWSSNEITTDDYFVDDDGNIELYGAEISVNDTGSDGTTKLSNYFTAYNSNSDSYGYLCGYMDKDSYNNKWYVQTVLYYLKAVNSNYKIAISVYPKSGTSYVDSWPVSYIDFTASSATYNNVAFTAGSNESSASEESHYPSVISVGSYVSSKYWRAGTTTGSNQSWTSNGTYKQISMFSSYQSEGSGPTGLKQPWITAPGEVIIAGYNSGYSASSNSYYAYGTSKKLGAMSGTSMATPCVSGIVALWLQANPNLTPAQIKTVMQETAITDTYTNGTYASHFGQGKIDALAGLAYILSNYAGPLISSSTSAVNFTDCYATQTYTQTISVTGSSLTDNITITKSGDSAFSIDQTSVTQTDGVANATITVTYSPTAAGSHTGTLTLTSTDAETVTISLSGTAQAATPTLVANKSSLSFEATKGTTADAQTVNVSGVFLTGNVTVAVSGTGFAVSETTLSNSDVLSANGKDITVTFTAPSRTGDYTGTLTLTSAGAETVTIALTGTSKPKLVDYTVYQLTSTLTAGGEYLIVSRNSAGAGYALGHSGTTVASDAVTVNAADDISSVAYINADDVDATSVWTVASGYTFKNGTYYIRYNRGLTISTTSTSWTWTTASNRLSYRSGMSTYYIRYSNGFSASTTQSSVYLYKKTTVQIEEDDTPMLSASQTSLAFEETEVGTTATKTFTVTGSDLVGNIAVTKSGSEYFTLDKTSIAEDGGSASATVTVTYAPAAIGAHTATVTLTSEDAQDVTVSISGSGIVIEPTLLASPTNVEITTAKGSSASSAFTVTGAYLSGNVTVALSDESGFFSIDQTSFTASQVEGDGQSVTVTFAPTAKGVYSATVTLSNSAVEDVVVTLTGTSTVTTKLGDVDIDGDVDYDDAWAIAQILTGKDPDETLYDHVAADVNKDGRLSVADITTLINGLKNPTQDPDYPEDDGDGHDLIIPGGGNDEPSEGDVKEERDF